MRDRALDDWLIGRIRSGDETAWGELVSRFEGRLFAFLESRLHNRSHSEDLVQETFLGLLTSLPNYDQRTPLESFLFAIAAHKLTDHLRRLGRRPTVPLGTGSDAGPAELSGKQRYVSSLLRSHERQGQESDLLREALADVIEACHTRGDYLRLRCLELLFVRGLPNKQVAEVLGLSEQAIANHKLACVMKLKEQARRHGLAHSAAWDA